MINEKLNSVEFIDKITSVVPTNVQKNIQSMGYYNFIHFGLNTFTGKEWGSGNVPLSKFKIKEIDTDQWVKDLKSTGSKGVILTAKHHDGFCLFDSKYTDYSIKNTIYRDGKGDLVKELADSCKKYDFKLGIYLSPWDRHEKTYGTDAYNDYFCNQLTELCTNYGEIFCFWFDGACGEGENGKKQIYDWDRYYKVIRTLQPNAAISNCGPDVRWIGNENGKCRQSEFSVVPKSLSDYNVIAENSQQEAGANVMAKKPIESTDEILGSRELLLDKELCWYPAEMDVSITKVGWFYHKSFELFKTRSVKELKQCYFDSVGNNAMLLLNIPPNKKGEMPKKFIQRIVEVKNELQNEFINKINAQISSVQNNKDYYSINVDFNSEQEISKLIICEDVDFSQRVEEFEVYADEKLILSGTTIGFKKICHFNKTKCKQAEIRIKKCRKEPQIKTIEFFE